MAANYIIASALSALLVGVPVPNNQNVPSPVDVQSVKHCGGGYLGVMIDDVDKTSVEALKLPEERGAKITKVMPESPAMKAGLQENDVIVKWNDTQVEGADQLRRLAVETPAGREVRLTVVRNGATQEIKAEMGKRENTEMRFFNREFRDGDAPMMRDNERELEIELNDLNGEMKIDSDKLGMSKLELEKLNEEMSKGLGKLKGMKFDTEGMMKGFHAPNVNIMINHSRLGAQLQNMSPSLAKYFGVTGEKSGALVGDVTENSAAAKAGLQAGDVITAIDGQAVGSPTDVPKIMNKKEGVVPFTVIRDKHEQTINVDLGKRTEKDSKEEGMNFDDMNMNMNFSVPMPPMVPNGDCLLQKRIIIRAPKAARTPRAPMPPQPPPAPDKPPTIL